MQGRFVNPAVKAREFILQIGDYIYEKGEPTNLKLDTVLDVQLFDELVVRGLVQYNGDMRSMQETRFAQVNLTLDGWERYEAMKRGEDEGNYGFMAMKFGDPELETLVTNLKSCVKEAIGCDLVDLRDVSLAGVIDNILAMHIRGAKFVVADLSHDNLGAYWEAGFAEGALKPVLYICKEEKFDSLSSTHFDTNHRTTVKWRDTEGDGFETFKREFIATLHRTLDLSAS